MSETQDLTARLRNVTQSGLKGNKKRTGVYMVLKSKSGASLMFVLAVMMLLMAISISVLTAAGASAGIYLKQKEHSQIIVLDESIQKNIMYSLQSNPSDAALLSRQLVMAIYEANDPELAFGGVAFGLSSKTLGLSLGNGVDITSGSVKVDSITLAFPEQNVVLMPPVPAIYEDVFDVDGNKIDRVVVIGRDPKTASISATMTVTVKISANGKTMTTRTSYEYHGGFLSDDVNGIHSLEEDDSTFAMSFTADGYGEWRLLKHEIIGS